jgi:hypothetical protein
MINPDIPTQLDVLKNPQLGDLNPKNPYLRSSDPSLIVQVMLTKMNDSATADLLASQDLSDEYTVSRGVGGINGFLVDITGEGETPEKSITTTQALGNLLQKYLHDAQKINGADDAYLFSSIVVATPDKATEQFSSRLRALIAVFLGGVVMMFGAVSVARSMAVTKERRQLLSGEPEGRANRRQEPTVNRFREEQTGPSDPTVLAPHLDGEHSEDESKDLKATQGRRLTGLKK